MRYHTVLFDLDGTLTDPGEGITNSVRYALGHYGITVKTKEELYPFIGPPLIDSFMKYYDFSHKEATDAVCFYREYFKDRGIFENMVYPGVRDLLSVLSEAGCTLILATSKPEVYAKRILCHFDLDKYFHFVCGATMDESRSKKEDVIAYALQTGAVKETGSCVMVGDRSYDILGGKKFSLSTVGVTYGYGSYEELTKAGADHIVQNTAQLLDILMKK